MPTDPNIHPHWAAETKSFAKDIDQLDYYQILECAQDSRVGDIKARYHHLQRTYHPDTFYQSPDEELKEAVFRIAKRVAEAYVILRDPVRRDKYTRDINGPDRLQKLRYTDESEQEIKKEAVVAVGKTPQGRKLVEKAMASLEKGDFAGAERDLKTALLFESDNESIKKRLEQVRIQLKK
ncbi:MAG: DnaJ domain-containing protein [Deltaproteobacteria bacterium]|nr:DnaJ domain-containing protein [Deltaproteobacteria bacterium]